MIEARLAPSHGSLSLVDPIDLPTCHTIQDQRTAGYGASGSGSTTGGGSNGSRAAPSAGSGGRRYGSHGVASRHVGFPDQEVSWSIDRGPPPRTQSDPPPLSNSLTDTFSHISTALLWPCALAFLTPPYSPSLPRMVYKNSRGSRGSRLPRLSGGWVCTLSAPST